MKARLFGRWKTRGGGALFDDHQFIWLRKLAPFWWSTWCRSDDQKQGRLDALCEFEFFNRLKRFTTIDEYIKTCPEDVQSILEKIRQTIRNAAPEAIETISYGIPTFNLDGKYLVYFAAWKNHIALYPIPSGTEAFKKEVAHYKGTKGSVHFPFDKPIPYDLVETIVRFRMKEDSKGSIWTVRSKRTIFACSIRSISPLWGGPL